MISDIAGQCLLSKKSDFVLKIVSSCFLYNYYSDGMDKNGVAAKK